MMYRYIYFFLILTSCSFFQKKEQKTEIQKLSEMISEDPQNIDLLYQRVSYNNERNNLESALYDLKEIVQLDSLSFINHNNIAKVYFELSKTKRRDPSFPKLVRYHLEKSINLNSNNVEAFALLGELMLAYYKYEDAIKLFNSSLKINYNQERVHMLMGYAFKEIGVIDNAIDCFRNSLNVNPDFFEAHMQLGQIFHSLGDSTALIYYNNALKLNANDEIVLYNKALFFQEKQDWNNALETYAQLHIVNPFHVNGHYNIGFIHMELKLYDIATNNFSDAIYSNSEFYEAYYSRGICFETLGNIAQAESDYKRSIEINPDYLYAVEALKNLKEKNIKYN
tara:strand:- start:2 stop:1015 length:1014 start_codon:yes stop_codon:yes gene_type:complete